MSKQGAAGEFAKFGMSFPAAEWMNGPAAQAIARANEACSRACQEWQQELVRFTTARMQADSQHVQRLFTCQSWAEAARLHQVWATAAAQDFAKEANQLFQLASKLGADLAVAAPGKLPTVQAAE